MMWAFFEWRHFTIVYVIAAIIAAVCWSGMPEEYSRFEVQRSVDQAEFTDKVRSDLPQYAAEVDEIRTRLERDGFTDYDQFLTDRERLVVIRDLTATAAGESYDVSEGSEFYAVNHGANSGLRVLVDLSYEQKQEDRLGILNAPSEQEGMALRQAQVVRWTTMRGETSYSGLSGMYEFPPIRHPFSLKPIPLPAAAIGWMMAAFYVVMIPLGFMSQLHKLVEEGFSVVEEILCNPGIALFFSLAWPLGSSYHPQTVARNTSRAWLERVKHALSPERYEEVKGKLSWGRAVSLRQIKEMFEDVAIAIDRKRSSRLQRVLVATSVLLVMLKPSWNVARAQEAELPRIEQQEGQVVEIDFGESPQSNDSLSVRYVEGKSAVEIGPLGPLNEPIRFTWRNTFGKLVGRGTVVSHADNDADLALTDVQLRPAVSYGPWTVFTNIALDNDPRLLEAHLTWSDTVWDRDVSIQVGLMFVPYQSAIPPPFGGMLDGALTNAGFDFFGEGLSVSVEPLNDLDLTIKVFRPSGGDGIPASWLLGGRYKFASYASFGFQGQIGADPDEDWLLSAELTGKIGDSLSYEVLGVFRERRWR